MQGPLPASMHVPLRILAGVLLAASFLPARTVAQGDLLLPIEEALEAGDAEKAAKLVDRALPRAGPDDIPALRYLRFKIHVYDLGPGGGKLVKKAAGGKKLEPYAEFLDGLETEVRELGAAALPFLTGQLASGDALDRLLILGLFEGMAAESPGLGWTEPAAGDRTPVGAAIRAIDAAVEECVALEETHGAPPAEAIQTAWDREDYVQDIYAARSGLVFVAGQDAAAWGMIAVPVLACRGAAAAVRDDLERIDAFPAEIRGPILASLSGPAGVAARVDALAILGRVGECEDLEALEAFSPAAPSTLIEKALSTARKRIRRRGDCSR